MKRLIWWTCAFLLAFAPCRAWAILIDPTPEWTYAPGGSNFYYLNGNVDGGTVLAGQISYGGRQVDRDGNQSNSLATSGLLPNGGAKSLARIGDYYFITNQDGGVGRFDATGPNAWNSASWAPPSPPSVVDPGATSPESITTDGTWLFANSDANRDHIYGYSVANTATDFTLTQQWDATLPGGHRVRGLTYDADSGFLYMHNGGDSAGTTLYAIDASDGTVYDMGTHSGEPRVYEVLRYGDELLVFGTSDNMTVYDLANDTTIGAMTQQTNLGVGDIYGAAVHGDTLFVAHAGSSLSGFAIAPEPASVVLLISGGLALLLMFRRRRRA